MAVSPLPTTDAVLQMRGISKRFGPISALADVDITVRRATVHALCGENGAGKSTLVKILAGIFPPDQGTIELGGRRQSFAAPADAHRAGIAMIHQELDLAGDLTVAENIFLGAEPHGRIPFTIDRSAMIAGAARLAAQYGFAANAGAVVRSLPAGECQIVEILKALRRRASLMVMDEPTSSLSENESIRLFEIVRQLRSRGMSVVYISHRLDEVLDLADDISILRDGRVVASSPRSGLNVRTLVHHMVGRELSDYFPPRAGTPGEICFSVRGLSTSEGISDISFEVRRGEIVGMAGLVGAGRTEAARAIFGVVPAISGEFRLDGRRIEIKCPSDAIELGFAFLTEDRKRTGLCLDLPCYWNIALPNLPVLGMSRFVRPRREAAIAAETAERINVKWASPHAPAGSLSGGNQQKLLVARWLLADSRLMIFDEPTRGIDVGARREIYSLLRTFSGDGKAILLISSDLPELFGIADRILVMRGGRLVGNFATQKTTPDEIMHLAAVG